MVDNQTQRQMPPSAGQHDDLYAQISAGDAEEFVKTKNTGSFVMNLMVWYMRMTLTIDEKRREYAGFFRVINRIWQILMGGLYLCGIATFGILVVSYLRFPSYIKDYLEKNNVLCEDIKIPYIISQVDLYGLHDKEKTYRIDKVSLSSTFSDFLNRRARNVAVDGVQITLEDNFKKTQNLLKVLSDLNGMARTAKGIKVDSLDVSRATFSLKGQNYLLPVSFTMTGIYGKETNIVSTISVDQPFLKAQGNLTINNAKQGTTWTLNIPYGTVALPGRSGEAMSLNMSVVTDKNQISKISGNVEMTLNQIKKQFNIDMENKKGKGFGGTVQLNWSDVSDSQKPVIKTSVLMDMTGVSLDKDGIIRTKNPIKLDMSTAYGGQFKIQKLSTLLNGNLTCKLSDRCTYNLARPAQAKIQKLQFPFMQIDLENSRIVNFDLMPSQNSIVFVPKEGMLSVNLNAGKFKMEQENTQLNVKKTLTVPKVSLVGQMNVLSQEMSWTLAAQHALYEDNIRLVAGANLLISDIMQPMSPTTLSVESFSLKDNSLLKVPVKLTYINQDGKSYAEVSLKDHPVRLMFEGYYNRLDETIDGTVLIPTIDLAGMKMPWSKVSSVFPDDLRLVSGKVGAYGHISGRLGNLKGPVQVALSDIVAQRGHLKLNKLNTNLILKTIVPFETEDVQRLFVDEIQSIVPLTNVDLTVKLAAQYAQIEKITAQLVGAPLYGVETIIPYHDVGTLLYLRNKATDLTSFAKQLKIPNWALSGKVNGTLLMPLTVKDFEFGIRNASAQFNNLTLAYTGQEKGKPKFLGKDRRLQVQTGTVAIEDTDDKKLRVAISLDGQTEPSHTKKSVREAAAYNPQIWPIIAQKESQLPSEIRYAVQDTLKKTTLVEEKQPDKKK